MNLTTHIYINREIVQITDVRQNFDQYVSVLLEILIAEDERGQGIGGAVTFKQGNNQVQFSEEIIPLMMGLYHASLPLLSKSEPVIIRAYSYSGNLYMIPQQDDQVAIYDYLDTYTPSSLDDLDEKQANMTVDRNELIDALEESLQLFIDFCKQLIVADPDHKGLEKTIETLIEKQNWRE